MKGPKRRPLLERWNEKVQRTRTCWLWRGAMSKEYGIIRLDAEDGGKVVKAHRASWILYRGPIPDGFNVLHSCDNGRCVKPDHLFLGTQADNVHDAERKGRMAHGKNNSATKLTVREVIAIREMLKVSSLRATARQYSVHYATITAIRDGRTWKWLRHKDAT